MKRKSFSNEIREAITGCGISQNALSIKIGVNRATMSRFLSGKAGLSLELIDRVADELDLHVTVGKRKAGSK